MKVLLFLQAIKHTPTNAHTNRCLFMMWEVKVIMETWHSFTTGHCFAMVGVVVRSWVQPYPWHGALLGIAPERGSESSDFFTLPSFQMTFSKCTQWDNSCVWCSQKQHSQAGKVESDGRKTLGFRGPLTLYTMVKT